MLRWIIPRPPSIPGVPLSLAAAASDHCGAWLRHTDGGARAWIYRWWLWSHVQSYYDVEMAEFSYQARARPPPIPPSLACGLIAEPFATAGGGFSPRPQGPVLLSILEDQSTRRLRVQLSVVVQLAHTRTALLRAPLLRSNLALPHSPHHTTHARVCCAHRLEWSGFSRRGPRPTRALWDCLHPPCKRRPACEL